MVQRRRSMATNHWDTELTGVDWKLPSAFGLTRRTREPRRSFRDVRSSSGMLESVKPKLAGVRVSVPARKLGEEEGIGLLGLIHGGGSLFIEVQGRRLLIRPICITILYHNLLLFIDTFHI
jgi:hypothetical protein